MKAISVLGTSSNSGKSWFATALCAWLRRKGLRVAPFKAQNMSNNSYVTLDGGEIGRAQAVQAEACGLIPTVEMNPILLKPSGELGSQLIVLGKARGHIKARDYYAQVEPLWQTVCATLKNWESKCDVLVLEGAGSPVELNLMERDIVNLRPVRELDGRWILMSDIERGGVFAQIVGTWTLLEARDKARGLGLVVNKFRGDLSLFADAEKYLRPQVSLPYLGVLPFRGNLQPESEDSLCREAEEFGSGDLLAWIRFPHISNSHDAQPWRMDGDVRVRWVTTPEEMHSAKAIVLPGTKDTLGDMAWLRSTGLATAILSAAQRGIPVVGICGGYQMLGQSLVDESGVAGSCGTAEGLNLLPLKTVFTAEKQVSQVKAFWNSDCWTAYEIHMGVSEKLTPCPPLLKCDRGGGLNEEGCQSKKVWGTYLHGLFESPAMRSRLANEAGFSGYVASDKNWREAQTSTYTGMADLLDEHLNMKGIWNYVAN